LILDVTSILGNADCSLPPDPEGEPEDPVKDTPDDLGGEFISLKFGAKGSGDETRSLEKDCGHSSVIQGKTHSHCALSREELWKAITQE